MSVSPGVTILTAQHPPDDIQFRVETRPVRIEDHVFIGMRAIIVLAHAEESPPDGVPSINTLADLADVL